MWGVEDASKKYFGVSASEVSLDQAATLAGMLKGPELYNPLNSVQDSTNRRDTVLQNMLAAGYIDKNQETEAAEVDMTSQLHDKYEGKISDYRYPSYFDAVVNEAVSKYNLTEEEIVNNGYRIYTELDQNYQANMQVVYENTALFPRERMEHLLNQEVSLSNRKQEEFVELSVKLLTMIKLDSGISTMQLNQNVALVLQLSL